MPVSELDRRGGAESDADAAAAPPNEAAGLRAVAGIALRAVDGLDEAV
jgi:hypothetical protein